jgi:hypothetical protein
MNTTATIERQSRFIVQVPVKWVNQGVTYRRAAIQGAQTMPGEETNHSRQIYRIFIGYFKFSGPVLLKQSPSDASAPVLWIAT